MILASSVFPAACRSLTLLISKCEEFLAKTAIRVSLREKNSYGFQSWGKTPKKHYLKHTRFLARWWWELERQSRSLAILVSWGYTCAFSMFLWKHREWTCASMEAIVDPWPKTHFKLLYTSVLDAKVFQVKFIKWAAVAWSRVACVSAHALSFRKDQ